MGNLPGDAIAEILARLPIKSLFREFLGIPVDRFYPSRFDLVCFHNCRGKFCLWNPATRQLLALPCPSPAASELDRFYYPYYNIGFGYSSSRDEYKVVQLFDFRDQIGPIFGICCEVYSVSSEVDHHQCSNVWRKISEKCPHPVMGAAACVQDVLHWMASDEFFQPLVAIVSFDLNEEKFRTMPVSPQWMEMCEPGLHEYVLVVEFWCRLCLFNYWTHVADMTIGVWMVKDYDKGLLEKCYNINLAHMEDSESCGPQEVLGCSILTCMSTMRNLVLEFID
ncbi:UNVERIFIED_CONTAM: hypothetical protein Slati_1808600 [Sesamum latifolium]|uniref:F-box associated beta-propeller type 3 domain-containing protein n=1 Tax=Sesamum latifolium TaxID=2727402 RepID=A0AAW2X2A8_9LAMI